MKTVKIIALGLAMAISSGVFAHSDEYLDTVAAPHGGQLRMAGTSHYELVLKPDALQVYVTDHAGSPTPVQGATGSAIVLSGKTKQTITLTPKGENLLEGAGNFVPAQPVKAVINIHLSGQEPQQARFDTGKAAHGAGHEGHAH